MIASPAMAAPELTIGRVEQTGAVEIIVLNPDPGAAHYAVPERITAGTAVLTRAAGQAATVAVPAGGFARLAFVADKPSQVAGIAVPLPAPLPADDAQMAAAAVPPPPSADGDRGNAFLGNLSAYEPIYAVYGPGTNSDARLQISFKYQLFGDPGAVGPGAPALNGLHFAFTQRLFWNLGADSSPFRNVDYMPEIFYLVPARPVGQGRLLLGGQIGARHESNGRDGLESRSLNTVYIQPTATVPVGDYKLTVGPRLWAYVGDTSDNPDIRRYRGNTGLFAEFGQDDGLRFSATGRMNLGNGKGAIDTQLSYPLDRIVASNLNLYVFGQAFAGYGENLLDYDRVQRRVRIGIGIVR
ncbi:phospholipase A [Sphingomonas sp. 1P06PA]|uniref:phospholipase A n=1 Tax=Sphingomonas sp. 1P06PA TaxID=554121 RepID=UPI0039A78731